MKKDRELLCCGIVVFVVQIVMLLIRASDFSMDFPGNPMLYIYGKGLRSAGYDILDMDMWMINISLYCLYVIKKAASYQNESAYMLMARYGSYRRFYSTVYCEFVCRTFSYQIFLGTGAFVGYQILRGTGYLLIFASHTFMLSQVCMLVGNLFFGSIVLYCIFCIRSLQLCIVVYPGIPVISFFVGTGLSPPVNNCIPGNWLMLARSSVQSENGYNLIFVLLVEILFFGLFSYKVLRRNRDGVFEIM